MFRMPGRLLCLLLTLLGVPMLGHAQPMAHIATVTEVIDGDTVLIAPPYQGLNEVRLVGIQAPKLALGRVNFKQWPLAPEAKTFVEDMVLDKRIGLWFGGTTQDRHSRLLAHLYLMHGTKPGAWVQGAILDAGMARVYSFSDNRSLVAGMLARETEAREAKRGIWALDFYRVRSARTAPLLRRLGTFQIIEARVRDTADVKGQIYLNFGDDWRTDFTISIRRKYRRAFDDASLDLLALKNQRVRIRGWLSKRNGPMIRMTHPEQIEVID